MTIPLILKPIVTEKTLRLAGEGIYTFSVPRRANKLTIANVISSAYKVDVVAVNISKLPGKPKRRGRITGKTNATIKAVARLKKGQTIPGFELTTNVTEDAKDDSKSTDPKEKK